MLSWIVEWEQEANELNRKILSPFSLLRFLYISLSLSICSCIFKILKPQPNFLSVPSPVFYYVPSKKLSVPLPIPNPNLAIADALVFRLGLILTLLVLRNNNLPDKI
jgi:hypothetical protein